MIGLSLPAITSQPTADLTALIDDWLDLPLNGAAIAGIIGLVEVAKRAGLPSRFGGLLAVLLALVYGVGLKWPHIDDADVVHAVLIGLSAAGVYSQTKALGPAPAREDATGGPSN